MRENRIKLLISIVNDDLEHNITEELRKYKIPFHLIVNGKGTASPSLLDYFGIEGSKRSVTFAIIPESLEIDLLYKVYNELKFKEPGYGVAFTLPISSSSKYLSDNLKEVVFEKEVTSMKSDKEYHLIFAIVQDGYAEDLIVTVKKAGARGATLIKGRGLGNKDAVKFLGFQLEPERDIVLIAVEEEIKTKIMETIVKKAGITTPGKGICFSLKVDNAIGLDNVIEFD